MADASHIFSARTGDNVWVEFGMHFTYTLYRHLIIVTLM